MRRQQHRRVFIRGIGAGDYTDAELVAVRALLHNDHSPPRFYPGRAEQMTESQHAAALLHEAKVSLDAEFLLDEWPYLPPAPPPDTDQLDLEQEAA